MEVSSDWAQNSAKKPKPNLFERLLFGEGWVVTSFYGRFWLSGSSWWEQVPSNPNYSVILWCIPGKHWMGGQGTIIYPSCVKCLLALVSVIGTSLIYLFIQLCVHMSVLVLKLLPSCWRVCPFSRVYWNTLFSICDLGFSRVYRLSWTQRYTSKYFCLKATCPVKCQLGSISSKKLTPNLIYYLFLKFRTHSVHMHYLFFRTFAFFAAPFAEPSCWICLDLGCAVKN